MKIPFFYSFLLCVFLLSCDGPAVTFEHPQPLDVPKIEQFPKKITGKYLSLLDSSILTITSNLISRGFNLKFVMCKKALDTLKECLLKKDTLYNSITNEKKFVVTINDTLYIPYSLQDTLFYISDKHILKKDRGYYFLNMLYSKGWEVQKLEYKNGKLCLCSIADIDEVESLRAIAEVNGDSTCLQFDPDKKQFRRFLKAKGFSRKEEFLKLQ